MTYDKNWPQLSAAQIDAMVDRAVAQPQEPGVFIWFSRPALALAASLVLLVVIAVTWSLPHAPVTIPVQNVAATTGNGDAEFSDYMMYELLDDLT